MAARNAQEPVVYKAWAGLKNTCPPENLTLEDLQVAVNVDADNEKGIMTRGGQTLRLAGSYHSLWAKDDVCLVADGTNLKRARATGPGAYVLDTVRSGLTAGARLSYWMVNGQAYYVGGGQTGVVKQGTNRTFGLAQPAIQPAAQAIGGGLVAGRYQWALTFLRDDGQESGTGLAGQIDLGGQGGIGFTGIEVSADPTVTAKALYLTATNGEVLYRAITIQNADTTAAYRNEGYDLRLPLATQFGRPAPVGHIVAWHKGRMLVAQGPALWYSAPYRYELFMLGKYFLPFEADINLVAPVEDGIFVGADKMWFISGLWDGTPARRCVAEYGAIPGTLAYEQGEYIGDGIAGRTAYWASSRGHCVGTNGGSFKNLSEARYSYPTGQRGAGIVRQTNGINQYLAVIEGDGPAANAFQS